MTLLNSLLKHSYRSAAVAVGIYACFLGLMTTKSLQTHAVYLHAGQMTWFKDLNVPEMFGFLRNQVTPFSITSSDGETLFAWHILPLELYREHEEELIKEPSGHAHDITSRLGFKLLKENPKARVVIHFHGAGGTVGSGHRCPNYRALAAGDPNKIHVITFDYRGYGYSTGTPSEDGILLDAISVVNWVINVAGIPPSRIALFGQSLGTGVALGVLEHFALQSTPVNFAGAVLVASFVDVPTLVATYRIVGTVPILGPFAPFPVLFKYLSTWIYDLWPSKERIASFVKLNEANSGKYRLTLLHAEDDHDVPWWHTRDMFRYAVNATVRGGIIDSEFEKEKDRIRVEKGPAGSVVEWRMGNGVIREEILKYGLHDFIMGTSVVTISIMRVFQD